MSCSNLAVKLAPLDQESPGSSPGGATESATRTNPDVALSLFGHCVSYCVRALYRDTDPVG